ncbi:MAG TPA: HlyD family efflux transporter periplasmic adaptor subunit [Burkholderiales bacterium]
MNMRWGAFAMVIALTAAAAGYWVWQSKQPAPLSSNFASGNGRIEAVDIDIAAKTAGRVREILVDEGDLVQDGQVLARMDTDTLVSELRQAKAQVKRSENARATAVAVVRQRESARTSTVAIVEQRKSELALAETELKRSQDLVARGFITPQKLDSDRTKRDSAQAGLSAAQSQVFEAESAIVAAHSQVTEAESAIEAARAAVERLEVEIADATLKAPRAGRIQHRVAQPGEVLGNGGKLLTLIDLNDVYMNFFLPESTAGKLALGAEARLVLDAAPQYVFPATVSFVASEAQFTPKTVETSTERQKLVFRVKARLAPELLQRYLERVKTGLPGVAYVRLAADADWPAQLQVKLPQ